MKVLALTLVLMLATAAQAVGPSGMLSNKIVNLSHDTAKRAQMVQEGFAQGNRAIVCLNGGIVNTQLERIKEVAAEEYHSYNPQVKYLAGIEPVAGKNLDAFCASNDPVTEATVRQYSIQVRDLVDALSRVGTL